MATVTKKDLIDRISDATKQKRVVVKTVVQTFLENIIIELGKGNRLEFRDFGVFEPKTKASRIARNPRTGAKVQVPEKTVVKFKVGRLMKKKIQADYDGSADDDEASATVEGKNGGDSGIQQQFV